MEKALHNVPIPIFAEKQLPLYDGKKGKSRNAGNPQKAS